MYQDPMDENTGNYDCLNIPGCQFGSRRRFLAGLHFYYF